MMFQMSIRTQHIPSIWKTSHIIPVPKKSKPSILNDYRPVALTPIIIKCFERIILNFIRQNTGHLMDPLQFAYRARRGVEDALISLLHKIYVHLENSKSYVRILFADFSSAFNTIQPHLMLKKLLHMEVNINIIKWVEAFLVNRPQCVRVNSTLSDINLLSTGAPQGCVLSPVLFTLYTNDCVSQLSTCLNFKFADDAALAGFILHSELEYRENIKQFTLWCKDNFLSLNVKKTKEMIIDFRSKKNKLDPVCINGQEVETVDEYKYLGTIIDNKLSWKPNSHHVHTKAQQRLFYLRKLRAFNVDTTILKLFYQTFINS